MDALNTVFTAKGRNCQDMTINSAEENVMGIHQIVLLASSQYKMAEVPAWKDL